MLRPLLVFVHGEDVSGARGEGPRRGHIGEQHEAARLCLQARHVLGLRADGRLQPRAHGFDRAWLLGAGPAAAIHRPFLHSDVHLMVGGVHGTELHRRGFGIRTAEILLLLGTPCGGLCCTIRGLDVPLQPLLPPFVLRARVDHHGPIGRPVERAVALIGFLRRHRTLPGGLRVGEHADLVPRVVGHSLGNEPSALVIGGREAGDEQGVAKRGQIVLGHQRRIGHRDIGAWCHPMRGQEGRNGRQEGVVDGFIRGIAILRFAPEGDGTIDAQSREDELLQIRPLILAIALGDPKGSHRLLGLLWRPIIPIDADGRRIKVHVPFVQPIDLIGTHSTGGKNLHGPNGIETL